jgi:CPA2 family monovalent cation:H+ antiporter-2
LEELRVVREEASSLIVAVSIMEDIFVISALAILQSVASAGTVAISQLLTSISVVTAFIIGTIVVG